ncbi:hypothetical protein [Nostoc sp.]
MLPRKNAKDEQADGSCEIHPLAMPILLCSPFLVVKNIQHTIWI